jgi:hypothetical protein
MEQANERAASMIERPEAVAEEEDGDKGDTEGKKRHYEVIFSYYGAVGFEVTAEDEWDAREQAWELWQKMPSAEIGENVGDVWSVEAELLDDDGDGEEGDKEEGDQD